MIVLRFEDSAGVVRLDLNTETGFKLGQGLDLGEEPVTHTWLKQTPHVGAVLAATHEDVAQMFIPLLLLPQASFAAMQALMVSLRTELGRKTNILRFQAEGAPAPVIYNTYRATKPPLFRGQEAVLPGGGRLYDPLPIPLVIFRDPTPRSGVHI